MPSIGRAHRRSRRIEGHHDDDEWALVPRTRATAYSDIDRLRGSGWSCASPPIAPATTGRSSTEQHHRVGVVLHPGTSRTAWSRCLAAPEGHDTTPNWSARNVACATWLIADEQHPGLVDRDGIATTVCGDFDAAAWRSPLRRRRVDAPPGTEGATRHDISNVVTYPVVDVTQILFILLARQGVGGISSRG